MTTTKRTTKPREEIVRRMAEAVEETRADNPGRFAEPAKAVEFVEIDKGIFVWAGNGPDLGAALFGALG